MLIAHPRPHHPNKRVRPGHPEVEVDLGVLGGGEQAVERVPEEDRAGEGGVVGGFGGEGVGQEGDGDGACEALAMLWESERVGVDAPTQ